jgi:hypothetical protein
LKTTTNTIYNFKTTTTEPPDSSNPTPPKPGQIKVSIKPGELHGADSHRLCT